MFTLTILSVRFSGIAHIYLALSHHRHSSPELVYFSELNSGPINLLLPAPGNQHPASRRCERDSPWCLV